MCVATSVAVAAVTGLQPISTLTLKDTREPMMTSAKASSQETQTQQPQAAFQDLSRIITGERKVQF